MKESHALGPTDPPLRDITLGELLAEAASQRPDRPALIAGAPDPGGRRQWTYAELYADALAVARALAEEFEQGERVAVWAGNVPEWVILEFAAALAGLVLVTVNPSFQARELRYVLTQSRASGLLVQRDCRGNPLLEHAGRVRGECPELRSVTCLDDWDALLARGRASRAALPSVRPGDPVMIQYTSGTTGFPKGALLHHRGLINVALHSADRQGLGEGGALVNPMPLFHTSGCGLLVLGAVGARATLILPEQFEPGLMLELIETYRAKNLMGVPTMLVAMLEHPDFKRRDLSSIAVIGSGAATVPTALVQRLERELDAPFVIAFGQTECSPTATNTLPGDSIEDKANTVGPPMPHTEAKIVDPETGATVPVGTLGEFCTRGYHVMLEYFDMPEATEQTIDADGWLHTGDLCTMDERGYCSVEGRLKDMIIRGGENIYPREIEEALFRHPSVGEVAVVGLPDARWGEEIGAFLRPAPGAELDREALFAYLRRELSAQKTPRLWFAVEAFPLTGSGKIQKFRLRELWQAGQYPPLG
ncbi:AMP-binding protein [Parahaliea mediterranea]|uniref:AMP-binding protein n=1 Tax=Parahaliea mediterranea TaxID=651086 RepID=A0A939IJN1_9GAMM|nr:AMP-binding protein [Parahaliea mediterranea]MBN7796471.1 AMP-binding protein [Parahaliea mediterranea]